jgi:hypothetical protein
MAAERYIKAIVYLTVLVWTIVLYVNHAAIALAWLRYVSTAVALVLYAVMAFDLWLWKLSFLHGWVVKRPVIEGTWKVEMRSTWKEAATGVGMPPIAGFMVVRQTLSTLSMRLMTAESSSELVGTEIVCSADGLYCVSGVYRSEPRLQVRDRSPIHYGAVWLRVIVEPTKKLIGHYWTDRDTKGEMELSEKQNEKFQDFQSARDYYEALHKA